MKKTMAIRRGLSTLFLLSIAIAVICNSTTSEAMPACRGTIGECTWVAEEFGLTTETVRRALAATGFISYGALQRDAVPCSQRGASYYNCRAGAEANPYDRGCNAITRCRS